MRSAGSESLTPADAKRALYNVLERPDVYSVTAYVAHDLADMRFAFPEDDVFASAVVAVASELARALRASKSWGKALEGELMGWRRSAFPSVAGDVADLRLIYRARDNGIDVLMFGQRHHPDTTSIYFTASRRK